MVQTALAVNDIARAVHGAKPAVTGGRTLDEMERLFRKLDARIVFLHDKALHERRAWLAQIYGNLPQFRYFEHSTVAFSSAREDYRVFIAHGEDPARLGKILRRNRPILASRIKVALMAQSLPQDRAQLLNAGYDLVVDTRMAPAEFVARIASIHIRQFRHAPRIVGPLNDLRVVLRRFVAPAVPMESLSNRELLLLARLAARKGLSVHASELAKSAEGHHTELTRKSLCVAISRLRRKLDPAYEIVSDYLNGYVFRNRQQK